jgi:excisionase family DNA binding protein
MKEENCSTQDTSYIFGPAKSCSVSEFAEFLGCSQRLVWKLIHDKTLGHVRVGTRVVLLREDMCEFLQRHSIKPKI